LTENFSRSALRAHLLASELSWYDAEMGLERSAWLLVVVGINCGSSGGPSGTLDCAWLAGDNCWKTTASAAVSCLPPPSETGTFSADKSKCTYASGAVVTFTPPPTLPVPQNSTWNFSVANGASPCLAYREDAGRGLTLTVMGQTFTESPAGTGLNVKCPDGTSFGNSNALTLLSCPGGSFGGLPGIVWSGTSTSLSVGLINTSGDVDGGLFGQSLPVFDCSAP
jgi:hypothetical protein